MLKTTFESCEVSIRQESKRQVNAFILCRDTTISHLPISPHLGKEKRLKTPPNASTRREREWYRLQR